MKAERQEVLSPRVSGPMNPAPWRVDMETGTGSISEDRNVALPCPVPWVLKELALFFPPQREAVEAFEGALVVDLYANPSAKAAQDALVAALPAPRRCEVLLSAAKAEADKGRAWPAACAGHGKQREATAGSMARSSRGLSGMALSRQRQLQLILIQVWLV